MRDRTVRRLSVALILFLVLGPATGCLSDEGLQPNADPSARNETNVASGNGTQPVREDSGWPPVDEASIRPGVRIVGDEDPGLLEEALDDYHACTSNFLFQSPDNASLFLGTAAHCVSTTSNPCSADSFEGLQPGDEVAIEQAKHPGTLVYSSFFTMSRFDNASTSACGNNDLALVEINASDRPEVHPAVLEWGGPSGLASDPSLGDPVLTYGQSPYRAAADAADARQGRVYDRSEWMVLFYPATALPGDSGGPLLTGEARGLGVVTEVGTHCVSALTDTCSKPSVASNRAVLLEHALAFMEEKTGVEAELVTWEPVETSNPVPGS